MASQNTIEILIKANSSSATKALGDVDKELRKVSNNFNSYMSGLKSGKVGTEQFGDALLKSGKDFGLTNSQMIRMTQSSGLFSKSQLSAAESMYKAQSKADELAGAVARGEMTSRDAAKAFGDYTKTLNTGQASLQTFTGGMMKFIGVGTAVVATGAAIVGSMKGLADGFQESAFQVDELARTIGATPEEASKLIQVADDVRVSFDSIQTAMEAAIRKGYKPTIEELGNLSDKYLALPAGIERAKFLMDTFGRSGNDLARLMELGSSKLKEMGASIEGTSRLMTSQGIQAATDYYNAVDNLGDKWEEIRNSIAVPIIGKIIVPALTGLSDAIQKEEELNAVLEKADELFKAGIINRSTMENVQARAFQGTMSYADATKYLTEQEKLFLGPAIESTNATIEQNRAMQYATEATDSLANGLDNVAASAQVSTSDLARMAGEAAKIKTIDAKLEFSFPNFADKMQNLIDSVNWNAAGGSALDQFMKGFSADIAGKAPEVQKQIAADVGAVDIALRVETGEITKSEGIQQLMDLAGTDYSKAKSDIETIMKLEPADITPYLQNIIGLGESTPEAAKQTEELSLKIGATDTAMKLGQASFSNWNTMTDDLEEKARQAAAQVGALNTQLKSIPKNIDVKINITSSGGKGKGNTTATGEIGRIKKASGGPVSPNQWYMVGERGPELFMPNAAGRIIPNSQITNNNSADKTIYITNNYTIAAGKEINVRELARQVAREQQRAGVT